MFDSDTLSPQVLVSIVVILALIMAVPFLLSFRRRQLAQKREEVILDQRRRDVARWQELHAESTTRKSDQDDAPQDDING